MPFDRFLRLLTSMRLTVFCLACALVLVFAGTLAQVHLGLYITQERYFHSLFVFWGPAGSKLEDPGLAGGIPDRRGAAGQLDCSAFQAIQPLPQENGPVPHPRRVNPAVRRAVPHGNLPGGELSCGWKRAKRGITPKAPRKNELAIVNVSDPNQDKVVSVPESRLAQKGIFQCLACLLQCV